MKGKYFIPEFLVPVLITLIMNDEMSDVTNIVGMLNQKKSDELMAGPEIAILENCVNVSVVPV